MTDDAIRPERHDPHYGWRKRIGLITPSANTVNEPEFYQFLPHGVSLHTSRMEHVKGTVENQKGMNRKMERCASLLATANVDVVVFGCTTGSLVQGAGYERELEERLSSIAGGVPAVTTAAAVTRAFDHLDVSSIAVTTPYPEELDRAERAFLEESGYEVRAMQGLGIEDGFEKAEISLDRTYRDARSIDDPDADAVFISCANVKTFPVIEPLEAELGKPVITSNQATLWNALRAVDVDDPALSIGRLFDAGATDGR